jgi:Zn ribbon nucleic-acid-binding protein
MSLLLESTLTCPHCGTSSRESMPEDACIYYHECAACGVLFRPKPGDCCVFCSYGDTPCPPVQQTGRGCCDGG